MLVKINIYQICYSPETMIEIPAGFKILDNTANQRPDWREYWPIRNFLLKNRLQDDVLYGFFSPKFNKKTNLNFSDVDKFIKNNYSGEDVVSFSPFWDLLAIFKSVFEQGDFFHPGLMHACQKFVDEHASGIDIGEAITHNGNSIFCNYFVAKKSFWLEWLALGELLYNTAESRNGDLATILNEDTTYGAQKVPMKVFVQERLATICLLVNKNFTCLDFDPFLIGASATPFNKFFNEAVLSDALKRTYDKTGHLTYLNKFSELRNQVIKKIADMQLQP